VFWLDETRAHDAEVLKKVRAYLAEEDAGQADGADLTIEVMDRAGQAASLALGQFAPLQPQIEFHTLKHRLLEKPGTRSAEPVFQTYEFSLAAFQARNPNLDTAALATIRLIMDESEEGLVILDNVGIRP